MAHTLVLLLLLLLAVLACSPTHASQDGSVITAHIIPHSHDDGESDSCFRGAIFELSELWFCAVGFRETMEQYYITRVRDIYSSVVEALALDPSRRFIAVEIAYVYRSIFFSDFSHLNTTRSTTLHRVVERCQ